MLLSLLLGNVYDNDNDEDEDEDDDENDDDSHRLFMQHGKSHVSKLFSNYKFPSCLHKALFTLAHTKNKLFLYLSKCHVIGVRDRLLWIDVF